MKCLYKLERLFAQKNQTNIKKLQKLLARVS